jgi:alpha-N-arabinofuranosidase
MQNCTFITIFITLWLISTNLFSQSAPQLTLHLDQPGATVSPTLYGLMTEEINHSYDGGLYAELIRNRIFKDNTKTPDHWTMIQESGAEGIMSLDHNQKINNALTVCLRVDIENCGKQIGVSNDGYWGVPVKPNTTYKGSFYAKSSGSENKTLTVGIESVDGKTIYASAIVSRVCNKWQEYHFTLTTPSDIQSTADAKFVILANEKGIYWFNLVSLFPPTYDNRPNGNRPDIMNMLAAMKPAFLRFPGGNYLGGNMFSSRFEWEKTIGNMADRPGHMSPWGYRSTDGMGLLEFLEWCEDLKMQPVLAVFAGYTLNRDHLDSGAFLKPFVDDALNEIQYITGDLTTKWGAERAKDGHPQPFTLNYVEIGNEDGFDLSVSYAQRYLQFYDAIKAKYPNLHIISTVGGRDPLGRRVPAPSRDLEIVDEHYYRSASQMESNASQFDSYSRTGLKVFVGEWATREGSPTTNMNAALGDAAWMTGMERNSDLVTMASYAPLFVNVNQGAMQWKSDLIGYNALECYGSPSYYAQTMFCSNIGNKVVPITGEHIPTQLQKLTAKDSMKGLTPKEIPALFYVATRDTSSGMIYLKIVNTLDTLQKVMIHFEGKSKIIPTGESIILNANSPGQTNSINNPDNIVPHTMIVKRIGKKFNQILPAYSITVMRIKTRQQ